MSRRIKKVQETDAVSQMKEQNPGLFSLLMNTPDLNSAVEKLAGQGIFNSFSSDKLTFLKDSFRPFLKHLKVSARRKQVFEARLRAVSFLNYHHTNLEGVGDTQIANLIALLLAERKRGIALGRKEVIQAKKKRK